MWLIVLKQDFHWMLFVFCCIFTATKTSNSTVSVLHKNNGIKWHWARFYHQKLCFQLPVKLHYSNTVQLHGSFSVQYISVWMHNAPCLCCVTLYKILPAQKHSWWSFMSSVELHSMNHFFSTPALFFCHYVLANCCLGNFYSHSSTPWQ